ncbi:galactoside alpha-(1,2)-fucosyltransferase 1-like [Amphibalanus amphitrite]|uniref:galactoside alpha-(1,2)-fucosyltransferase 1-like n=1 Tax=Amphibalanus amphitrite TaxID=1232801 RepID=UPI001C927679|nr:galactoside alpha-(1,2)-fucosyltransferase 1-like [Amphibalanus amphitrite]
MIVHHVKGRRVQLLLAVTLAATALVVLWVCLGSQEPAVAPLPEPRLTRDLRTACRLLLRPDHDLPLTSRERVTWVCGRLGVLLPWRRQFGCGRRVTYEPAGSLEQDLLRYAVLFGLQQLLRAESLVEPRMLEVLQPTLPGLTLPVLSPGPPQERWQPVAFWPALDQVRCRPGEVSGVSEPQRYRLRGPPDGSALSLLRPFEESLRRELRLSSALQRDADRVLLAALGRRPSATYIGVLLPPDGRRAAVPPQYLRNSLSHYRRRFSDALFIVVVPNVSETSLVSTLMIESDVTLLPAEVAADPSLSLAVRAACNHSVVTGDEGFWGAFLAGGQVTVPPPERSDAEGFGWLRLTTQLADDPRWTVVR